MSEKTVGEWLEELPEPYRTAAISQTVVKSKLANSLSSAIGGFTTWDSTKEGGDFWCAVYEHYRMPNDLPPYPDGLKNEILLADIIKATKEIIDKLELLTEIGTNLSKRGNKAE